MPSDALHLDGPTLAALRARLRSPETRGQQSPYAWGVQGLLLAMQPLVRAGRWADRWLYPGFRDQAVTEPFFIFANARSGSTLLHRLLSLDHENFAHLRMYQTLLPAVCWQRFFATIGRLDQRIGGPGAAALEHANQRLFSAWKGIHATGLNAAEEDEALFALTLLSPSLQFVFPDAAGLERALWVDALDEGSKRRLQRYYLGSVRRHLYATGGQRRLLNKSVLLASRLRTVSEMFPDGRFVYLVRHPYESIPSFLSMFHAAWRVFAPQVDKNSPAARALAQLAIAYYRYALDHRAALPSSRFLVLRFADLVAAPMAQVERVYAHFSLKLSRSARERIAQACQEQRSYRSRHRYTLEEFGLQRRDIYLPLRDVFEEFGFDPGPDLARTGEQTYRPEKA